MDFSAWQRPNYIGGKDTDWDIMYNQKVHIISTNIPADCFELRYKVEKRDLGPE
jgi:hypothetical protein